ncbi:MAG TPA: DUF4389 domain-containing protein [Woeseiaceae bacterium]
MTDHNPPADHVTIEDKGQGSPVEENLKSRATWTRALYMLISYVLISLACAVGSVVVVLGFFWVLFKGEVNPQIRSVGQSIATYIYEVARFLTFNTEEKPFPLGGEWPAGEIRDSG